MEIIKIVSFALAAVIIFMLLGERKKELAVLVAIIAGAIIFLALIDKLSEIINFIGTIADKANIDMVYIGIVLKILAIAYLSSFCSEICKDAGASSIASKVEFAGKILILAVAIPILMAVLNSILQIL